MIASIKLGQSRDFLLYGYYYKNLFYLFINYLMIYIKLSGDLVDAFPLTKLRPLQINDLKKVLNELDKDIKIVCVSFFFLFL